MPNTRFSLKEDFPSVAYEEWRKLAEVELKGASFEQKLVTHIYEGIDVQPLYSRRDQVGPADPFGFPGQTPFVRGPHASGSVFCGFDLRQEHANPDLKASHQAILDDLAGGVTSLLLRLDHAARDGYDPDDAAAGNLVARDGLAVYSVDDLATLLAEVKLDRVGISLTPGASFLPAAAMLVALWRKQKVSPEKARGSFNADPLTVLAREGHLPYSTSTAMRLLADLALWTQQNYPRVTAVAVDTAPYHHAGATAAQDLAYGLATGVEYLRAMTAAGLNLNDAVRQIEFDFSLGTHHFLAICKLRAARLLWARVVSAAGGEPKVAAMRIHARTGNRVLTQRDPYVNLLRNTVGVFAAAVAGADSITSVPFDAALGQPDEFSRRIARNTLLVLQEESHLHRVMDPAGGSWFLDAVTQQLADKAWEVFQQVEGQGGMLEALTSGWVSQQLHSAFATRAKDIARRKTGITGVSEFPDVGERPVKVVVPDVAAIKTAAGQRVAAARKSHESLAALESARAPMAAAVTAAEHGVTLGQMAQALGMHHEAASMAPLELHSFAEPFELLRDATDAYTARRGKRPTVFLANLGSPAHHTARAMFSKNFFEAGGLQVLTNNGFRDVAAAASAFKESGASIAVICSSDKLYPELVPDAAHQLKAAGARSVIVAGAPGTNEAGWRIAGVDRFIFVKCDVLATLREILHEEGVIT